MFSWILSIHFIQTRFRSMVMQLATEISEKNYGIMTGLSTTTYYTNIRFLEGPYVSRVKCTLMVQHQKTNKSTKQTNSNYQNKIFKKTQNKMKNPTPTLFLLGLPQKQPKYSPSRDFGWKKRQDPNFLKKSCWFWGLCILPQFPLACRVRVWVSHQRQPKTLCHGSKTHVG